MVAKLRANIAANRTLHRLLRVCFSKWSVGPGGMVKTFPFAWENPKPGGILAEPRPLGAWPWPRASGPRRAGFPFRACWSR